MAPTSTVYLVRHAEGYHQQPREDDPDQMHTDIRDAKLTDKGIQQANEFCETFEFHDDIDLICASPLRRTIQTAQHCFQPNLDKGMRILAVPEAQEASADPSDTGSPLEVLQKTFSSDMVDLQLLTDGWWKKDGENVPDDEHWHARANKLRHFLKKRPEHNIVLVAHGTFLHYVTEHIDPEGHQTGEYWQNVMCRSYKFKYPDDPHQAHLMETADSLEKHPQRNPSVVKA